MLFPEYAAVIGCVPTASEDLVIVATPPLRVADPITVVPSLNATFPVAVFGPAEVTLAVKITGWPWVEGFGLEVRLVIVGSRLTTWVTLPVLGRNEPSPG